MTTLIDRSRVASPPNPDTHVAVSPVEVTCANPGQHSMLEGAQSYFVLRERPIPLCGPTHKFAKLRHIEGYHPKNDTSVAPCKSPGKAPLERGYPRFSTTAPSPMDIVRMFGSHQGNIGGVVPGGRLVIDIDPRNGGVESMSALNGRYGTFPETPTVRTGGKGIHNHFLLPEGVTVLSGGSLAALGYPGVERKGPGTQVVLPPSIHESGRD